MPKRTLFFACQPPVSIDILTGFSKVTYVYTQSGFYMYIMEKCK